MPILEVKKTGDGATADPPPPGPVLHAHDLHAQQQQQQHQHHMLTEVSHPVAQGMVHEAVAPHPDHHEDNGKHPKLDPKTQALIDQMNAVTAKALADMHAAQEKAAAKEKEHALKRQVMGPAATLIASNLSRLAFSMNDANSKAFIQQLDSINDPDMRAAVKEQFKLQHMGEDLEHFISNCSDWNNNGANRDQKAALQLISKERDQAETNLQEMDPTQRAAMEKKAREDAGKFLASTAAHDHSDENMQKLFRTMGHKSPEEIELMRQAVQQMSAGHTNMYQAIDDGTHNGDEDEAVAMLEGNPVHSARAALTNETDPKRMREVLGALTKEEAGKLDPFFKAQVLARFENPSDRAEVAAMFNQDTHLADAEHLGNLLKPKDQGIANGDFNPYSKVDQENYDRRKPKNVIKEFEGMSGEDVKAAAAAWDKAHAGEPGFKTFKELLKDRWGDDEDKTELNRLTAMIDGDKEKNRSIRFEEGQRTKDQDEIEASLAHDTLPTKEELNSPDAKVKENAIKKQEDILTREAKFEKYNVEDDQKQRKDFLESFGITPTPEMIAPRSSKQQLTDYYDARAKDDIGSSFDEKWMGGDAADMVHAKRQSDHDKEVKDHRAGAMDLLETGKLSVAVEVHRAKSAKDKLAVVEKVKDNDELAEMEKKSLDVYGEALIPKSEDSLDDMSTAEVQLDQMRVYGVKSQRPAQLEHRLQAIVYKHGYSESLEADEAGRLGTQSLQRYELEAEGDMLKDPGFKLNGPTVKIDPVTGFRIVVDDPKELTEDQLVAGLPKEGEYVRPTKEHPLKAEEDGLKDGITKEQFNQQDEALSLANEAQQDAKKRMAERLIKIFATIAKIAAALTLQPELIAAIDIAEGVLEIVIKKQIIGKDYSMKDDLKMLAITGVADIALMGFAKYGKGAAKVAEEVALKEVEQVAVHEAEAGLENVAKGEIESEVKHEATAELEHVAQNEIEQKVTQAAENKVAGEVEGQAAKEVEQQVAKEVENEAVKDVEHAAENAAKEQLSPAEIAKKVEAQWGLYGNAAKMVIQTVGGGIATGKSPSEILKGLVTGGLGLVIPGAVGEKIRGAIGDEVMAAKILGELLGTSGEYISALTINVAGGADPADAALDTAIGVGGGRIQHYAGSHGGGAKHEEPGSAPERSSAPEATIAPEPAITSEATAARERNSATIEPIGVAEPVIASIAPEVVEPRAPEALPVKAEETRAAAESAVSEPKTGEKPIIESATQLPEPAPRVIEPETKIAEPEARPTEGVETRAAGLDTAAGATSVNVVPDKGGTAFRSGKNSERTVARAGEALVAMEPGVREQHETLLSNAESPVHKAMLERAIAAGHTFEEVNLLNDAMKAMGPEEVIREFSGHGLAQGFKQTCVPTSYQIAIAEVDPVYALHLKNNPHEMVIAQGNAVTIGGGELTQRTDLHKPNEALRAVVDDPAARAVIKKEPGTMFEQTEPLDMDRTGGIEATQMQDQHLHKVLEKVTGTPYEVITNEATPHDRQGAGEFNNSRIPHDRIARALENGQPVLIGTKMGGGAHERTIVGREIGPNGEITYLVTDPHDGGTSPWNAAAFDALPAISITLPAEVHAALPVPEAPAPLNLPEATPRPASSGEANETRAGAYDPATDPEVMFPGRQDPINPADAGATYPKRFSYARETEQQILAREPQHWGEMLPDDIHNRADSVNLQDHAFGLAEAERERLAGFREAVELRDQYNSARMEDDPNAIGRPAPEEVQEGSSPQDGASRPFNPQDAVNGWRAQLTEIEGERAATKWMVDNEQGARLERGFTPGRGYDQVWLRGPEGAPIEIIIVEGKGPSAQLADASANRAPQMTPEWVKQVATEMVNDPTSSQADVELGQMILDALDDPNHNVIVSGRVLTSDGAGSAIPRQIPGLPEGTNIYRDGNSEVPVP